METQTEPKSETITTRSVGIRYGAILGAISIVSFLVVAISAINVSDGGGAWANRGISTVFSIVIFYLAHDYFKKNGDGFMSFGQGFGIGFWASLVSSIMASVFMYVYVKFIDSGFVDMIKENQLTAMQERGMSDEQIEQAMKIAGMFTTPEALLIFGIIFGLIGGLIIALITSIFTQKKNPDAVPY